jgi:hypothetical protein
LSALAARHRTHPYAEEREEPAVKSQPAVRTEAVVKPEGQLKRAA